MSDDFLCCVVTGGMLSGGVDIRDVLHTLGEHVGKVDVAACGGVCVGIWWGLHQCTLAWTDGLVFIGSPSPRWDQCISNLSSLLKPHNVVLQYCGGVLHLVCLCILPQSHQQWDRNECFVFYVAIIQRLGCFDSTHAAWFIFSGSLVAIILPAGDHTFLFGFGHGRIHWRFLCLWA